MDIQEFKKRMEDIEKEINKYNDYQIRNALTTGISSLPADKAKVQSYLDRITAILDTLQRDFGAKELEVNEKKHDYLLKFQKLLYQDESVKSEKSERLREAAANAKILKEFNTLHQVGQELYVIKIYKDRVQKIKDNLISKLMTATNISKDCILAVATGDLEIKMDLGAANGKISMKLKTNKKETEDF